MTLPIEGTARKHLKTVFKASRTFEPFYTGGPIAVLPLDNVSLDGLQALEDGGHRGDFLVTALDSEACVTHTLTGQTVATLETGGNDEPITAIHVSLSGSGDGACGEGLAWIILATRQGALWIYKVDWEEIDRSLLSFTSPVGDRSSLLLSSSSRKKCFPLFRHVAKAHDAPIFALQSQTYGRSGPEDEDFVSTTLFASGSADGIVKVWDLVRGYTTHVLKGHGGVVSAFAFLAPSDQVSDRSGHDKLWLASGADDAKVIVWDLKSKVPIASLSEHLSVVRGLDFRMEGDEISLLSASRDKIVNIWSYRPVEAKLSSNAQSKSKKHMPKTSFQLRHSIPTFEAVESSGWLREEDAHNLGLKLGFWTVGEEGLLKIWNAQTGKCLTRKPVDHDPSIQEVTRNIIQAVYHPREPRIILAYSDQNIGIMGLDLPIPSELMHFVGFNDEIVDCLYLSPSLHQPWSQLALATNSPSIVLYDTNPGRFFTTVLQGHSGIVLSLARSSDGKTLVSGSKDKTARVWRWIEEAKQWLCMAVLQGHTDSVSAVAISKKDPNGNFVVTGSQDRTIKVWDISGLENSMPLDPIPAEPRSMATMIAHEKDINSVDIAPNDRLVVSASQDRTAKLFSLNVEGSLGKRSARLATSGQFRGHKRGVWTVRFSPTDQVIATSSGDKTVKIWSIHDFSCIKTLEGHTNSVLRAEFFNRGMQIISSGSDGLVKVWAIRTEECVATLDNHTEKVWSVCMHPEESTIISVAADSVVNFWSDFTEADRRAREEEENRLIQEEQEYLNFIQVKDYRNAIRVAISLNQPYRLLKLFNDSLSSNSESVTNSKDLPSGVNVPKSYLGDLAIDEVVENLTDHQILNLLTFVRNWNTNSKTSQTAQIVLQAILALHDPARILELGQLRNRQKKMRKAREQENLGPFAEDDDQMTLDETRQKHLDKKTPRSDLQTPPDIREIINALLPYTERHYARASRLVQDSYVIDWTLSSIDEILGQDSHMNNHIKTG